MRLIVFTGICVLLPPLWGLAAGLSFYLLFPDTAKRVALITGSGLIVFSIASMVAIGLLILAFVNYLFNIHS
jgi:hypothetical protein